MTSRVNFLLFALFSVTKKLQVSITIWLKEFFLWAENVECLCRVFCFYSCKKNLQKFKNSRWIDRVCFLAFLNIIFICYSSQIKAKGTLMEIVAADWLRSDKREDDLGGRPGGIVQVFLYFLKTFLSRVYPLLLPLQNLCIVLIFWSMTEMKLLYVEICSKGRPRVLFYCEHTGKGLVHFKYFYYFGCIRIIVYWLLILII